MNFGDVLSFASFSQNVNCFLNVENPAEAGFSRCKRLVSLRDQFQRDTGSNNDDHTE